MTVIHVVAAVVVDEHGRLLVVRKRGTSAFMQPGGKFEAGEDAVAALRREVREELGVGIATVRPLGRHTAAAANEPGHTVAAELFAVTLDGPPRAAAEIAELTWLDRHRPDAVELAPLTRDAVLALLS